MSIVIIPQRRNNRFILLGCDACSGYKISQSPKGIWQARGLMQNRDDNLQAFTGAWGAHPHKRHTSVLPHSTWTFSWLKGDGWVYVAQLTTRWSKAANVLHRWRGAPLFSHRTARHKHTRLGRRVHEGNTFLIIKGNSKGKQWPEEHAIQRKTNPEPNSTDGYTACCSARADAREETSHKLSRHTIQSLASGFFSCQPCLMSSHNGWLLCRKQQRKRLKRSMCHTASTGNKQCQVSIAVSCTCQWALESLLHFQK